MKCFVVSRNYLFTDIVKFYEEIDCLVSDSEEEVESVVYPVYLHAHNVVLDFFPGYTGPPSKMILIILLCN